ncbi:MAG: FKBP-type peptidyl-prolyl cis-trans isomerase [Rubripirellula sp.]
MIRTTTCTSLILFALISISATGCSPRSGPMLIDDDAPTDFTTTESGLKYRILRKSNQQKPRGNSKVEVDYRGWLDDGSTFDSSYSMREPASFSLSNVIPAWTEGLQLLGEGGMIELEVPPELGYGEAGNPPSIPPNATLHFKVELLRILN